MKRVWKAFLVAAAVAAVSLTSATIAGATPIPIISIAPSTTDVATGDSFTLDLLLTNAVNVASYQLSVAFDPSVLSVTSVTDGTFLDNFDSTLDPFGFVTYIPSGIDPAGTIAPIAALLFNTTQGVSGDGLLASIQFKALSAGTTVVTPFFDALNADGLFDWDFLAIETTLEGGTVNVTRDTTVPEPTSMLTLALGLGSLLARRRRQTRPVAAR